MATILDTILEKKKLEIQARKSDESEDRLRERLDSLPECRGFVASLRETRRRDERPAIIAEIKRGSPSKGIIREDLAPVETAIDFAQNGASCLSVLTDESFFLGSLSYLSNINTALARTQNSIPLLRKEFILDSYQVTESRAYGADAILLIVAALSQKDLVLLHTTAITLGLDVRGGHNRAELDRVLIELPQSDDSRGEKSAPSSGVNNGDLKTF
ncbi:UNVERIFIED_CONTAM: hypothetical protein GTU68_051875 [Idotea baltica]|nr:hypothetical protein [Idotea baltica]